MPTDELPLPLPLPAPVGTCTAADGTTSQTTQSACTGVWTAPTNTGGRRSGVKAKTLRRMLKKAGLKVSGKKSTLTKRCKEAHLMRGGFDGVSAYSAAMPLSMGGGGLPVASNAGLVGGRRRGIKAKTLKKLLKRAGLKVSGKKSTLRARAKKAHLVRGGA